MSEYELTKHLMQLEQQVQELDNVVRQIITRLEEGNKQDEPAKQR